MDTQPRSGATNSPATAQPVLLLRLEGPLQSWGARARWDVRDTAPEPTKSGIVGLLGCALGYPVGDARLESELDAGLRFGVRVENAGRVLTDYQTITDFLPTAAGEWKGRDSRKKSVHDLRSDPDAMPATIISPRAYLEDAAFLVALEERAGFDRLLRRCATALQSPAWPLYLGRKACIPTRPIFEALAEQYAGLEDALARHPWSWQGGCAQQRQPDTRALDTPTLTVFLESDDGPLWRQDAVRANAARVYGFRGARQEFVPLAEVWSPTPVAAAPAGGSP